MTTERSFSSRSTRREILKGATIVGGGVLAMPYLGRLAFAQPVELTMLAGTAMPNLTWWPSSRPQTTSSSSPNTTPAATTCWA